MKSINKDTLFKPVSPVAKTPLDMTTKNSREIVTQQTAVRNAKTERLRSARLAKTQAPA